MPRTCSTRMRMASQWRRPVVRHGREEGRAVAETTKPASGLRRWRLAGDSVGGIGGVIQSAFFIARWTLAAGDVCLFLGQRLWFRVPRVAGWLRMRERNVILVFRLARHCQRPSSNTASMLTDSVLSPGATDVSLAKPASAAIARIMGIGRGKLAPPSLMLTMRRTFRPKASA